MGTLDFEKFPGPTTGPGAACAALVLTRPRRHRLATGEQRSVPCQPVARRQKARRAGSAGLVLARSACLGVGLDMCSHAGCNGFIVGFNQIL